MHQSVWYVGRRNLSSKCSGFTKTTPGVIRVFLKAYPDPTPDLHLIPDSGNSDFSYGGTQAWILPVWLSHADRGAVGLPHHDIGHHRGGASVPHQQR